MVSLGIGSVAGLFAIPLLLLSMMGLPFGSMLVRSAPVASAAVELGEQGFWGEFVAWGFERTRSDAQEAEGAGAGQPALALTPAEPDAPDPAARLVGRWALDREHFAGEVRASLVNQVQEMDEPDRAFAMGMIDQLTASVVDQFDLILGLHLDGSLTSMTRGVETSGQSAPVQHRGSWEVAGDGSIVIRGGGPLSGAGGESVMRGTLAGPDTLDIRSPQGDGEVLIIRLLREPR